MKKANPQPADDATNSEAFDVGALGAAIKAQRALRGWTLEELSNCSNVSIAAISKIEKGQSSPSFDTILRIARCLKINFVDLLEGPGAAGNVTARLICTREADAERFSTAHYDYKVHSTALKRKVMVPLRMTIRNHEPPPLDEWSIHDGEEFIFVLKGVLSFHTEHYAPLLLHPGDSCYLDSTMKHAFVAASKGAVEIISVCLSIAPFATPSEEEAQEK
jgi:transcriptional regulator with XRE-family HTH domain